MSASDFPLAHRLSHIERLVDVIDLPIGRWDAHNRLVFCNEPYLGWAERTREELIGLPFLPNAIDRHILREQHPTIVNESDHLLKGESGGS